ncbi:hypothetical protein F4780DRAFT_781507 [Xylariomycetidae sp. FL0641]|nr:hypothetical protein F4780DRAFT_781507 [Xylariomycetidae sp. FL0641]
MDPKHVKEEIKEEAKEIKEEVKYAGSTEPPKGQNNAIKFWPFLAIIALGTGAFMYVANTRDKSKNVPVARPYKP